MLLGLADLGGEEVVRHIVALAGRAEVVGAIVGQTDILPHGRCFLMNLGGRLRPTKTRARKPLRPCAAKSPRGR